MSHGCESDHEQATIDRLKLLGYTHIHGTNIAKGPTDVVLQDRLLDNLKLRYPKLSVAVLDDAVKHICSPPGGNTLQRNRFFHVEYLTRGFEINFDDKRPDGTIVRNTQHIHPIDWTGESGIPNDFLVVNQLPISNQNDRRPDIIIYINGLPLVLFELKNPYDEKPTVEHALNQIQHYKVDIPQLFDFNVLCVLSDGNNVLHGMWTADMEWYAPWNSVDGVNTEPGKTGTMKTLIAGLFKKDRLLDYIRNFIVFEDEKGKLIKKAAKYHQFFAVNAALKRTLEAFIQNDKRVGVVWHTTGSGKSLSMAFLVGILRQQKLLKNPSFLIQVDRNDLDDQLHDQFVRARHLVGGVKQADSVDDLRALLRTEGGEVIFSTIEKFALKRGPDGRLTEAAHPVLSTRSNVIIIADEAHRSQYGFLEGYARYLNEALPNAKRLGFTGTPVSFHGADTQEVFGGYIHTYDIQQSQQDGSTVPIWYSPRQARLHLSDADINKALDDAAQDAGVGGTELERKKGRWAALAKLTGADDRVKDVAADILHHFTERTATLAGKAMVVCMVRANCVKLYDALKARPGCPEIKIVMTGDLGEDPKEWSEAGHLTTKAKRDAIKARMVDPDDPLKIVIVCDMWLTGTDIPCLHTLYIDKPLRGHNMIQAISRVNRVFKNKPHGLVVDYIGIAEELREATDKYTGGGGTGDPAPDVETKGVPLFLTCLDEVRQTLPPGKPYAHWRTLSPIEFEDLHVDTYAWLIDDDHRRDAFLQAEARLSPAFVLVQHLDSCKQYADEVLFCQRVRKQVNKVLPAKPKKTLEEAVRDIVDAHVESDGVVDIFALSGVAKPDISILDDNFLQTFNAQPHENLRLKLLERLLNDEIHAKGKRNLAKAKSFRDLLAATMDKYHKRIIDAAAVVQAMLDIKKEFDAEAARAAALGMSPEEVAFYDAIHDNYATVYEEPLLRELVHDVVRVIKGELKVDWTEPHRQAIKSAVLSAVRRVLRKKGVKEADLEPLVAKVVTQAAELWKNWPMAA